MLTQVTIPNIAIGEPQTKPKTTSVEPVLTPVANGSCKVDDSVIAVFPVPNTKVLHAYNYGVSHWGKTSKIVVELPDGSTEQYFLKAVTVGQTGRHMCEGEFESLKAIYALSPGFVPEPYAWGRYRTEDPETYFILAEFRDIGEQPAEPDKLAASLADMHQRSISPTGKFGFHFSTCHARIAQAVDQWDDSWCALYSRHLGHVMELAKPILLWPEFNTVCKLTLEKVVPRLLLPLQAEGRFLKPCLIHGDCWDGNTAMDKRTGEAFVFDVCSFYGHNEYDTGNWRAQRHRLSKKAYIEAYKRHFPVSEPEEDWDARNLLYSLTFNIGNTIYIPGSSQRQAVYDDMTTLCKMFCPDDLKTEIDELSRTMLIHLDATAGH
ncbi:hypothetical protein EJ05DRAFT_311323 [Pseudovirgaria hyperparasitica]|uniref:protein-ribulosamine 3-kinase n=1 Tax=Pseudovirgaria hyperparasitica TaxID=470096 RepID=A0A6A6WAE3_9PEZI|nr:uncharacterized protein EJ05DRAFT_311323 [Pseudovirgaria hyperparasitica]KAF2759828.1 hypothetical protein EJ05DRAFT_311323 [Pseudovirgaria hyperparasitica]